MGRPTDNAILTASAAKALRGAARAFTITFRSAPSPSPESKSPDDSGCWACLGGPVGVPVAPSPEVPMTIVPIRYGRDA